MIVDRLIDWLISQNVKSSGCLLTHFGRPPWTDSDLILFQRAISELFAATFLDYPILFCAMSRKMLPKRGREDDDPRVRCSKTLSYLLRHGAVQSGLKMTSDGYAAVADILAFPQFKDCTAEMIRDLVANDAKMRYSLRDVDGKMEICANQGHSLAGKSIGSWLVWRSISLRSYYTC